MTRRRLDNHKGWVASFPLISSSLNSHLDPYQEDKAAPGLGLVGPSHFPQALSFPAHATPGLGLVSLEVGLGHPLGVGRGCGLAGDSQGQQRLAGTIVDSHSHRKQLLLRGIPHFLRVGPQYLAPVPPPLMPSAERTALHPPTEKTTPLRIISPLAGVWVSLVTVPCGLC